VEGEVMFDLVTVVVWGVIIVACLVILYKVLK
jgi:hypothetical protein